MFGNVSVQGSGSLAQVNGVGGTVEHAVHSTNPIENQIEGAHQLSGYIERGEHFVTDGWHHIEDGVAHSTNAIAAKLSGVPVVGGLADSFAHLANFQTEVAGGVLGGAASLLGGAANAVIHPVDTTVSLATMATHAPVVGTAARSAQSLWGLCTGQRSAGDALDHALNPVTATREDAAYWTNVASAIAKPYQQSWSEGRYGELVGRGAFDIAALLSGTGEAEAAKGADAAEAARGADVAKTEPLRQPPPVPATVRQYEPWDILGDEPVLSADEMVYRWFATQREMRRTNVGVQGLENLAKAPENLELLPTAHSDLVLQEAVAQSDGTRVQLGIDGDRSVPQLAASAVHEGSHIAFKPREVDALLAPFAPPITKEQFIRQVLLDEGRAFGAEARSLGESIAQARALGDTKAVAELEKLRSQLPGVAQYDAAYNSTRDAALAKGQSPQQAARQAEEAGANGIADQITKEDATRPDDPSTYSSRAGEVYDKETTRVNNLTFGAKIRERFLAKK